MNFEYVKCNICGSEATESLGKRKSPEGNPELDTTIARCSSCGLLYPNPMPRSTQSSDRLNFNPEIISLSREALQGQIRKNKKRIRMIEKSKPQKGNLLDIGCGVGELVYVAGKQGWQATGIEVSKKLTQYAKEAFNIDLLLGDVNNLALQEKSFDVICLNSVLQYVQDPLGMLKKAKSLLKKTGILFIEITNEDALVFKMGDFFKTLVSGEQITTHLSPLFPTFQIYGFNKKSLSRALNEAGFKVSNVKIMGICGGGKIIGKGLVNKVVNLIRKAIVLLGGMTGNGHLIFCIAERGE
ncbi:MAG: methyltransferase domain-containing protein [Candidatus Omnitrophica bacterium]|nr:methyltransferase domain-containing protein [Candidatus Omnitrophota bacterium]